LDLPVTEEEFAALMAPLGPFGPAPRLAAGVSGGPDSLALALLAEGWAAARGGRLLALVVDHGLRPGSAAEAAGVVAALAARGIATRLIALGLPPGPALQARARDARLAALLAACREAGAPWLLLGHQRGDQAETLLFRALRGSGAAGLAAMAAVRARPEALVLRPLLTIPRARLEATVAAAGLTPVRDPANIDPRFARARLRAGLSPEGAAALAEAAAGFAARRARQAAALATRLAACASLHPEGWATIDPAALGADSLADAALAALLQAVSGAPLPPPSAAIRALRQRGTGSLGGALLRPGPAGWRLLRETAALPPPIPATPGARWDNRWRLVRAGAPGGTIGALGAAEAARLRPLAPRLPATVLASLPAIRRDGSLVAVPALGYAEAGGGGLFATVFATVFAPGAIPGDSGARNHFATDAPHSLRGGPTLS